MFTRVEDGATTFSMMTQSIVPLNVMRINLKKLNILSHHKGTGLSLTKLRVLTLNTAFGMVTFSILTLR